MFNANHNLGFHDGPCLFSDNSYNWFPLSRDHLVERSIKVMYKHIQEVLQHSTLTF